MRRGETFAIEVVIGCQRGGREVREVAEKVAGRVAERVAGEVADTDSDEGLQTQTNTNTEKHKQSERWQRGGREVRKWQTSTQMKDGKHKQSEGGREVSDTNSRLIANKHKFPSCKHSL